jgi:hypothetical protein
MSRNKACLVADYACVISTRDAVCGSHAMRHSFKHFNSQRCALCRESGFTRVSWQAFCTSCRNTCKLLISTEYIKAFRYLHSQKSWGLSSGDGTGQLTVPPRSIRCSQKKLSECSTTMQRNGVGGLCSCARHVFERFLMNYSQEKRWYAVPLNLVSKMTCPKI